MNRVGKLGLVAASAAVLLLSGCSLPVQQQRSYQSRETEERLKPSEQDVVESFNWLIGTIDGTMRATGRSKWVYERGFQSTECPKIEGREAFQFSWTAFGDGVADPVKAAQDAAAYLDSQGMKGIKAYGANGMSSATYSNDETGVYAQYLDGKGASVIVTTPCKPGNATEANKMQGALIKEGKLHEPEFFDPNA